MRILRSENWLKRSLKTGAREQIRKKGHVITHKLTLAIGWKISFKRYGASFLIPIFSSKKSYLRDRPPEF